MSKTVSNTIIKHSHKQFQALDLSPHIPQRKSIISVTDSSEILSTKISCKQSHMNKRPSIYTAEMMGKAFKEQGIRRDVYGTIIAKGSKEHQVSFADNVSAKRIAEVILIEAENMPNGKSRTCVKGDGGKGKSRNMKRSNSDCICSCGSRECCVV